MYKILVTNDDGIESPGIHALVKALQDIATVYVAAPAKQQSATSRHITFIRTVSVEEVEMDGAEIAYAVEGRPADCVMWAMCEFGEFVNFDFVLSGINHGENTSIATYYSATVAAALEGSMQGIRSIALSVENHDTENFEYICSIIPQLLELSLKLEPEIVLNVNAPDLGADKVKGVRITDIARKGNRPRFLFVKADDGNFQMTSTLDNFVTDMTEDYSCLQEGYVTITPLDQRMSAPEALKILRGNTMDSELVVIVGAQEKALETLEGGEKAIKQISKFADCVSRLGKSTILLEQYGCGPIIKNVEKNCDNAEKIVVADFDAFADEKFRTLTESIGRKKVYLAGAETHIAIQQTAKEFIKNGFEVSVVEECCVAATREEHLRAIENLRMMGCTIDSCESAIMELVGSSLHPAYSSIRRILRVNGDGSH